MRRIGLLLTVCFATAMSLVGCNFMAGAYAPLPAVHGITAEPNEVASGQQSTVTVAATDVNPGSLTYTWTATGGTLAGTGRQVNWTPPSTAGEYHVVCLVSNGRSQGTSVSVAVTALPSVGGGVGLRSE